MKVDERILSSRKFRSKYFYIFFLFYFCSMLLFLPRKCKAQPSPPDTCPTQAVYINQIADTLTTVNYPWSTFQWYLNGVLIPGANSYYFVPGQSGIYVVVVTTIFGADTCINVSSQIDFFSTALAELSKIRSSISPNPAKDIISLNITLPEISGWLLEIRSMLGEIIYTEILTPSSLRRGAGGEANYSKQFDLSNYSSGIYFLRVSPSASGGKISDGKNSINKKIIKN